MKFRSGFVSNSSSSSFVIFGANVSEEKLKERFCKDEWGREIKNGSFYSALENSGMEFYDECDEYQGVCIGHDWGDMRDDETKGQFKERVTKEIEEWLGEKVECELLSGEYMC